MNRDHPVHRRLVGVLAAVAVHVVALLAVISSEHVRPITDPYGHSYGSDHDAPLTIAFVIDEPAPASANPGPSSLPNPPEPGLASMPMQPLDSGSPQGPEREEVGLSMIYMAQVQARVERAWLAPGKAWHDFRCNVVIEQSSRGEVLNVTLSACLGTTAFRNALMDAIRRASPLPAPPAGMTAPGRIALAFKAPG